MLLRFVVFFSVLLLILASCNLFVHRRAAATLGLKRRGRRILGAILVSGLLALMGGRALARVLPNGLAELIGSYGSAIQLAVIISTVLLIPERLFAAVAHAVSKWRQSRATSSKPTSVPTMSRQAEAPPEITDASPTPTPSNEPTPGDESNSSGEPLTLGRRALLSRAAAGSALALGTSSAMYGALFGRHDYVIEEVPVKLAGLPRALDGFTIVQLSDIHIGLFVSEREMRSAVELVARAKPDRIVLTGDLIDHDIGYAPMLGHLVRQLSAIAPVAAVPGNHDYYAGLRQTLATIREAGADVLVNRGIVLGDDSAKFALLGVDDLWGRRHSLRRGPNIERAIATVPGDLPRVLLCHNPAYFAEAAKHVDLQLSGHTHGGQVNLGIQPAKLVLPYGYVEGHYRRDGGQLWVNRGFGTAGPPARVGAAPEVTRIVLTS